MIYYFFAPDLSSLAVRAALGASLCPTGAEIRTSAASGPGIVMITTPGFWRDSRGTESGLGVPGWSFVASEVVGEVVRDVLEEGKSAARTALPTVFVRV